jgi:hypothetical protein
MREPEPERMQVDVNWRAVLLFLPLIFVIPEAWGAYFGAAAIALLIGVPIAAIMGSRIKARRAYPRPGQSPEEAPRALIQRR